MINDFIEYWTATKLLLNGGNPYSSSELLASQAALGWSQSEALMMWNPPWTFFFTLPFGLFDYQTAQFAWFLSHTLIIFVGAKSLWNIYGGEAEKSRYAALAVISFAPTYFALLLGQIGPLILLGLIAFLASVKNRAWGLAGAALTLAAIKPHLLYLFWLALLIWTLKKMQWRLFTGFAVTGIAVALLPLLLDRDVYSQYFDLLKTGRVTKPLDWATPSLGTALAELLAIPDAWIRWLPSWVGAVWFLWYGSRRAETWNWLSELPLVLLVSVVTAGFVWTFDQVVLVPAVIQAAVWLSRFEDRARAAMCIGVYVALGAILLVAKIFVMDDFWYFWVAPAYLLFYLYVRSTAGAAIKIEDRQTMGA